MTVETPEETPEETNETPKEKSGGKWRATLLQELSSSQTKIAALESRLAKLETPETPPETTPPGDGDGKSSPPESTSQNTPPRQTSETPETTQPTKKRTLIFGPSARRKKS